MKNKPKKPLQLKVDPIIGAFALLMQDKLDDNIHKDSGDLRGWTNLPLDTLLALLSGETAELGTALLGIKETENGAATVIGIIHEALDVANISAMVLHKFRSLQLSEVLSAAKPAKI